MGNNIKSQTLKTEKQKISDKIKRKAELEAQMDKAVKNDNMSSYFSFRQKWFEICRQIDAELAMLKPQVSTPHEYSIPRNV